MADMSETDIAKRFQTPFAAHLGNEFLLKNYGYESFNLIGMVEKEELILFIFVSFKRFAIQ